MKIISASEPRTESHSNRYTVWQYKQGERDTGTRDREGEEDNRLKNRRGTKKELSSACREEGCWETEGGGCMMRCWMRVWRGEAGMRTERRDKRMSGTAGSRAVSSGFSPPLPGSLLHEMYITTHTHTSLHNSPSARCHLDTDKVNGFSRI